MIWEGIREGFALLFSLDPDVWSAIEVSLRVSTTSTLISTLLALPVALYLAHSRFPGHGLVVGILNTLMALPTVLVGLVVYALLSRSGPLGHTGILYSPSAMVVGQVLLAFPIVTALSVAAIRQVDPRVRLTALAMGAGSLRSTLTVMGVGRRAVMAAVVAGFGRVFAEVGISMMLGGNIKGYTRNITTGIAFETGRGEFARGVALGVVLLAVALLVNLAVGFKLHRSKGESA
jgi:tungstate transport system permease protein